MEEEPQRGIKTTQVTRDTARTQVVTRVTREVTRVVTMVTRVVTVTPATARHMVVRAAVVQGTMAGRVTTINTDKDNKITITTIPLQLTR